MNTPEGISNSDKRLVPAYLYETQKLSRWDNVVNTKKLSESEFWKIYGMFISKFKEFSQQEKIHNELHTEKSKQTNKEDNKFNKAWKHTQKIYQDLMEIRGVSFSDVRSLCGTILREYYKNKPGFIEELQERYEIINNIKRGLAKNLFNSREELINHLLNDKFSSFLKTRFPNAIFSLKTQNKIIKSFDKEYNLHIDEKEANQILTYLQNNFDEKGNRKTPETIKGDEATQLNLF